MGNFAIFDPTADISQRSVPCKCAPEISLRLRSRLTITYLQKKLIFRYHLFQLKTWVALVKGLNLTFHNIELNTIMQNVFLFIDNLLK